MTACEGGASVTDLFLSYKAEDRARVAPLVQALETDGLSVWWDEHIGGGEEWRETILRHLEAAKCVIVVWSKRSVGPNGQFVRDEATRALKRKVYLPVRIDKVDPPLGFGETQALDLTGWKGDRSDPRYQAVLASLRRRLGVAPTGSEIQHSRAIDRRTVVISAGAVAVSAVGLATWHFTRAGVTHGDSIAVLPFANLSGDPKQAYFSDGIAEELRSALARVPGLKVVGRTSSEVVRNEDAETAAKKLRVANILTGSVRQTPSIIRVSAQLVDGANGFERWSENYDRAPGDAIKIQTDIAENVARALSARIARAARAAIAVGGTSNAAAQNLVLEAVARVNGRTQEDLRAALSLVNRAIALDPGYAEAFVLKARALNDYANYFGSADDLPRYRRQALADANSALRLAPSLASAHNALALIYRGQLQVRAADREFKRALELAPGDVETIRDYARFAGQLGRTGVALRLADQALVLDSLNSASYGARFDVLMDSRRFEEAVTYSKQVQKDSPDLFRWPAEVAFCLIALGRIDEARRLIALKPEDDGDRLVAEAILFGRDGNLAAAQRNIYKLRRHYGDAASYQYAEIYAQARANEQAFEALDRAWAVRDSGLLSLRADPMLDPLRAEARFQALVKKLDFPT